jgi:hypothetical protein
MQLTEASLQKLQAFATWEDVLERYCLIFMSKSSNWQFEDVDRNYLVPYLPTPTRTILSCPIRIGRIHEFAHHLNPSRFRW